MNILQKILDWFSVTKEEIGYLVFAYGSYKVKVFLNNTPKKVWLTSSEPDCAVPIYTNEENLVSVQILPDGFLLSTEVKSNIYRIDWKIEY